MSTLAIKLVIVGDVNSGKTALIRRVSNGVFYPNKEVTLGAEFFKVSLTVNARPAVINAWNLAGHGRYMHLRPIYYKDADVVLICFSVNSPSSLKVVTDKEQPSINLHLAGKPIILVGTKVDLRNGADPSNEPFVSFEEGRAVANRIGARNYIECSAKTGQGIREVFIEAYRAVKPQLIPRKPANISPKGEEEENTEDRRERS